MINFIGISKNEDEIKIYKNAIDKNLIKWDFLYKCYKFDDNDKKLNSSLEKMDEYNVFIIDAETINNTEEIVKKIRVENDDLISFIIIMDLSKRINKKIIKEYDYHTRIITNKEKYKEILFKDIQAILNILNQSKQNITLKYDGSILKIPYSNILYIEKENNSKNCIIVCKNRNYHINKSIVELESVLGDRFIKTHRSALINKINIEEVDLINNVIYFTNKKECPMLSRSNKKHVKECLSEIGIKITN